MFIIAAASPISVDIIFLALSLTIAKGKPCVYIQNVINAVTTSCDVQFLEIGTKVTNFEKLSTMHRNASMTESDLTLHISIEIA